jgi:hypothetical protein
LFEVRGAFLILVELLTISVYDFFYIKEVTHLFIIKPVAIILHSPEPPCAAVIPKDPYPYFPVRIAHTNPVLGAV